MESHDPLKTTIALLLYRINAQLLYAFLPFDQPLTFRVFTSEFYPITLKNIVRLLESCQYAQFARHLTGKLFEVRQQHVICVELEGDYDEYRMTSVIQMAHQKDLYAFMLELEQVLVGIPLRQQIALKAHFKIKPAPTPNMPEVLAIYDSVIELPRAIQQQYFLKEQVKDYQAPSACKSTKTEVSPITDVCEEMPKPTTASAHEQTGVIDYAEDIRRIVREELTAILQPQRVYRCCCIRK